MKFWLHIPTWFLRESDLAVGFSICWSLGWLAATIVWFAMSPGWTRRYEDDDD